MNFGERLDLILKKFEMTQIGLAKEMGISNVVINRYVNNKTNPSYDFLNKIILHFNINLNWLLTGEGPMFPTRQTKKINDQEYYYLPVIAAVSCGSPQEIEAAEPLDHILVNNNSLQGDLDNFFAFYASGDSMEPLISNGDVIIVKQTENWDQAEKRVSVVRVDGEITLKKVNTFPDEKKVLLQPYNKDYSPILLDQNNLENSRLIGIAVMSIRNL